MGYADELQPEAHALADAISARIGRDPEKWWLAALIRHSLSDEPQTVSRSPFGFMLSAESAFPDLVRCAAQPGDRCNPSALETILAGAGDAGHEAAAIVRRLGEGDAWWRGDWQVAFGEGENDVRFYAGARGSQPLPAKVSLMRSLGLWPPQLDNAAADVLERLRPSVVLSGVARRFGGSAAYKIYTYGALPLRQQLVDYMAYDLPASVQGDLQFFLGSVDSPANVAHTHTWSLSLDSEGALLDWKLELTHHQMVIERLLERWPELCPFVQWVQQAGENAGVVSRPGCVSFRALKDAGSVVVYMAFDPLGFATMRS